MKSKRNRPSLSWKYLGQKSWSASYLRRGQLELQQLTKLKSSSTTWTQDAATPCMGKLIEAICLLRSQSKCSFISSLKVSRIPISRTISVYSSWCRKLFQFTSGIWSQSRSSQSSCPWSKAPLPKQVIWRPRWEKQASTFASTCPTRALLDPKLWLIKPSKKSQEH